METERLLKEHNKTGNPDVVQAPIEALDNEHPKRWKELVDSTRLNTQQPQGMDIAEETGCIRKHDCHPKIVL